MLGNPNSKVAIAMSLGMAFGGYLALNDRAQRLEVSPPALSAAVDLPDAESELLPPLVTRNHWHDLDAAITVV